MICPEKQIAENFLYEFLKEEFCPYKKFKNFSIFFLYREIDDEETFTTFCFRVKVGPCKNIKIKLTQSLSFMVDSDDFKIYVLIDECYGQKEIFWRINRDHKIRYLWIAILESNK